MFRNWKTTLFGISGILSGIVMIVKGDIPAGVVAIISGMGLNFAKDSDIK
jgi:hypothetical protein